MVQYSSASRWYYAFNNWTRCPDKFNFVAIYEEKTYSSGDTFRFSATIYRSVSGNHAKKNVKYMENRSNYRTYLLSRDQYNTLLQKIKAGNLAENFNIGELMNQLVVQNSTREGVKNKLVHIAWNMTDAEVVWVSVDESEAVGKATAAARENPTKEYLVLKPIKKVYQPANVTTDDL
jgi:hypothetical protein